MKSENGMLRRVDKDRRSGESEEVRKVMDENNELNARLEEIIVERKREIEFWVNERATMREMIEQLENQKLAQNEGGTATVFPDTVNDPDGVKTIKKKCQKKIKEKELQMKTLQKSIEDYRDEIHRAKQ